MATHQNRSAYL